MNPQLSMADAYICLDNQILPAFRKKRIDTNLESSQVIERVNAELEGEITKFYIIQTEAKISRFIVVTFVVSLDKHYFVVTTSNFRSIVEIKSGVKPIALSHSFYRHNEMLTFLALLDDNSVLTMSCLLSDRQGGEEVEVNINRKLKRHISSISPVSETVSVGKKGHKTITHCVCDGYRATLTTKGVVTSITSVLDTYREKNKVVQDINNNYTYISAIKKSVAYLSDNLAVTTLVENDEYDEKDNNEVPETFMDTINVGNYFELSEYKFFKCDPIFSENHSADCETYIALTESKELLYIYADRDVAGSQIIARGVISYSLSTNYTQDNDYIYRLNVLKLDGCVYSTRYPITSIKQKNLLVNRKLIKIKQSAVILEGESQVLIPQMFNKQSSIKSAK